MSERLPRVLVVEDSAVMLDIIQRRLQLDGMEPVGCTNGAAAKALLGERQFDAVVLDIMMPDISGFDVLEHVRATPALADLPVIMLTAKASPQDRERAKDMGADAYIVKPFGPHDLVRTLRDLFRRRSSATTAPAS
jgi:two-component system response regulator MtrA